MHLKVGDVVKLKTGGPWMTVVDADNIETGGRSLPPGVRTMWFTHNGYAAIDKEKSWSGPHDGWFSIDALERSDVVGVKHEA